MIANLIPDDDGVVTVPLAELAGATEVVVIIDDPAGAMVRHVSLPEPPLAPRDLRLRLALDPARHATQVKAIAPLRAGDRLVIEDLATAKVHLVDSVARAHGYLLALREDATLREFSFVTRWHELADGERREQYSKYACHELHLFLYFKDRPFFDEVVAPYLAHKRVKTFVDHWLLGEDLARYLEPAALARLNTIERALLARRIISGDELARILADEVDVTPPDPDRDARIIDALLGASTLDGDDEIAAAQDEAFSVAEEQMMLASDARSMPPPMAPGRPAGGMPPAPSAGPARAHSRTIPRESAKKKSARRRDDSGDMLRDDLDAYEDAPAPMYRGADKTQEWAENNWWHLTPAQCGPGLVATNRLWRDLARHREGSFLSPGLGLATGSFAEAMVALAVTDLPFVAGTHAITPDGPGLTIAAAANALAGSSQLLDGELVATGAPLVVGMSYVRPDDRYDWINGEQVDKYVEGPFATGVVYTCRVVLANPTSARQRIAALIQIPRGSVPVNTRPTQTIDVVLQAYGTHGHEYSFYFPSAGTWTHFPAHVSRGGVIVAAAAPRPLEVISGGAVTDPRSWPQLSQRGSTADVAAYLGTANLSAIDLDKIAWRLRDRAAYETILGALERRHVYSATLWGYALLHLDAPRLRVFLRGLGTQLLGAGPALDMLGLDAEELGSYEHLELRAADQRARAPARRQAADPQRRARGAVHPVPRPGDPPPSPDRRGPARGRDVPDRAGPRRGRARRARTGRDRRHRRPDAARLPRGLRGVHHRRRPPGARARRAVARAPGRPVAPPVRGAPRDARRGRGRRPRDRRSAQPRAAARRARREAAHVRARARSRGRGAAAASTSPRSSCGSSRWTSSCCSRASRSCRATSRGSRSSSRGTASCSTSHPPSTACRGPRRCAAKNVVVEAVGAGQRKAKVHYANDLATTVANQVGQVRVARASDHASLPATYVKVYARKHGGQIAFYKDGYTDLRGAFDYATLSTTDLDQVERFAILVCSDQAGAAIIEASPPAR